MGSLLRKPVINFGLVLPWPFRVRNFRVQWIRWDPWLWWEQWSKGNATCCAPSSCAPQMSHACCRKPCVPNLQRNPRLLLGPDSFMNKVLYVSVFKSAMFCRHPWCPEFYNVTASSNYSACRLTKWDDSFKANFDSLWSERHFMRNLNTVCMEFWLVQICNTLCGFRWIRIDEKSAKVTADEARVLDDFLFLLFLWSEVSEGVDDDTKDEVEDNDDDDEEKQHVVDHTGREQPLAVGGRAKNVADSTPVTQSLKFSSLIFENNWKYNTLVIIWLWSRVQKNVRKKALEIKRANDNLYQALFKAWLTQASYVNNFKSQC